MDGGRGLVSASFGVIGLLVFSAQVNNNISDLSSSENQNAFKNVILISSSIICCVAVLVYIFFKNLNTETNNTKKEKLIYDNIKHLLKNKNIWLIMIIIMCAYMGYKATDFFTLYTTHVMQYNNIESAKIGTLLLYFRPVIAIIIGFTADKTKPSFWLSIGFVLTAISSSVLAFNVINSDNTVIFIINTLIIAIGVYACRVLYFTTLETAKTSLTLTGTAVGLVSIIGYTPDIFSGPLYGKLLDNNNKVLGLQHAFSIVILFSVLGFIASILLYKNTTK